MNRLRGTLDSWREYLTPASHTSTFTATGQLTPEEFVLAGDYLCYKFPTWSWAAADASKRVPYLPEDKQYLVLKHAPCHTRLDDHFSTWNPGDADADDDDGWAGAMRAGAVKPGEEGAVDTEPGREKVKTIGDGDNETEEEEESEDEIPDMDEEEDDEAIIRDSSRTRGGVRAPLRTYNLYITYSTYYRVPRSYLSGHDGTTHLPLSPPTVMFEDIAPDYRKKTVTIEDFPCLDNNIKMASVHPCKHAEVMKRIFESMARRKMREEVAKEQQQQQQQSEDPAAAAAATSGKTEEWEQITAADEDEGLRVDQYLVVFVKFMAGVVPGVEMDYTMGI